ncbi:hypothetical protein Bca4012_032826 [Brassica carinata]|uniref:(rape) hypothetical protein n=1 Tax=Brassica napus TaxID=3708 RepID=A0A816JFD0_BRANA|nr:unnamed protein product [Brassica napus]
MRRETLSLVERVSLCIKTNPWAPDSSTAKKAAVLVPGVKKRRWKTRKRERPLLLMHVAVFFRFPTTFQGERERERKKKKENGVEEEEEGSELLLKRHHFREEDNSTHH